MVKKKELEAKRKQEEELTKKNEELAKKKREQSRLRAAKSRKKLKEDPVRYQQHKETEKERDRVRRAVPKSEAKKKKDNAAAKIRMQNSRKRNKDKDEADVSLRKVKGILKRKRTMRKKDMENAALKKEVEVLKDELSEMKKEQLLERRAARGLTPRSKKKLQEQSKNLGSKNYLGLRHRRVRRALKQRRLIFATGELEDEVVPPAGGEDDNVSLSQKEMVIKFAEESSVPIPDIKKMKTVNMTLTFS